jgi:hypothetical protein
VACMGEESIQAFDVKSLKGINHLEDQGIDWRIGSGWILGRLGRGGGQLSRLSLLRIGVDGRFL